MSLDFTMMYAYHDGLRRDAAAVARAASVSGAAPGRLAVTHLGWRLFSQFLVTHHTAEDDYLWPRMRTAVADSSSDGGSDDLGLLDAMEEEHGRIDPLLAAIEAAMRDGETGHADLPDLADELAHQLGAHLNHEEEQALPLISRILPAEEWDAFAAGQRDRMGIGLAPTYLPWLLDEATPARVAAVLTRLPGPLAAAYPAWREAFETRHPWAG